MGAKEDNLNLYADYNKTLRAWLVGFGFGVPALFIVNDAAQARLIAAQNAKFIIWLFLIGAAAQVLMALVNKVVSWCAYYKYDKGENNINPVARLLATLENMFIIDVVLDVVSLVAFAWSIILIVNLFV
ncbi:MAG TPA: hypothetical protein VIM41_09735 [Gammaproteobacteria bacterium]